MPFARDISPTRAGSDLIAFLREDRPYKLPLFLAACIPPAVIIFMLNSDALHKSEPPPPTVTYFESWPADRSIEETRKAIAKRQAEKDAYNEKIRQQYKAVGEALGMDVAAIEREAAQERAAKEQAEKERAAAAAKSNDGGSQ